jgi:hypothetical protein
MVLCALSEEGFGKSSKDRPGDRFEGRAKRIAKSPQEHILKPKELITFKNATFGRRRGSC